MELSNSSIKKLLIFSYFLERKLFSILGNKISRKMSYILSRESFSYISGNGNPKKLLIFQEVTFRAQKMKKKPLSKSFRKDLTWPENQKFLILLFRSKRKRKKLLYFSL